MNSILNIQESIDYIEEHILEPISIEELSKRVYMSQYHFQRMFGMIETVSRESGIGFFQNFYRHLHMTL